MGATKKSANCIWSSIPPPPAKKIWKINLQIYLGVQDPLLSKRVNGSKVKQYIHEIGIQGSPPIDDPEIQKAISMIKILINEENNLSRTFSYFSNDKIEKEFSNLK